MCRNLLEMISPILAFCCKSELLCCSLGSPAWPNWPKYPPPDGHGEGYEDVMHKLARLVEKSTFTRDLKVSYFCSQDIVSRYLLTSQLQKDIC